jgi:SAM-dependent methyltransferase
MDRDRITAITHGDLALHNPVADAKLDATLELLDLRSTDVALDLGCGPGEVLIRVAGRTGAAGIGVDRSRAAVFAASRRARERVPGADLQFVHADAAEFVSPEPFALAACVGSSHALGGLESALARLARAARRGGWVLLGEGYWRTEPSPEYLEALGDAARDELTDLPGLVAAGETAGLRAVSCLTASQDDWDRYEWRLIATGDAYAAAHPDQPGVEALTAWVDRARRRYLMPGGRETLGFALVLFRVPN